MAQLTKVNVGLQATVATLVAPPTASGHSRRNGTHGTKAAATTSNLPHATPAPTQVHSTAASVGTNASDSTNCNTQVITVVPGPATTHNFGGSAPPVPSGAAPKEDSGFSPFAHAHAYALSLTLKSEREWRVWRKTGARPPNIPSAPERTYTHDGWQGWGHWLGSSNQITKDLLPFEQAHAYALSLTLKGQKEWEAWRSSGARPANIPSTPNRTYEHDGWQGWSHWLGIGSASRRPTQQKPRNATPSARTNKPAPRPRAASTSVGPSPVVHSPVHRNASLEWTMHQAIDLKNKFATMADDARRQLDELAGQQQPDNKGVPAV